MFHKGTNRKENRLPKQGVVRVNSRLPAEVEARDQVPKFAFSLEKSLDIIIETIHCTAKKSEHYDFVRKIKKVIMKLCLLHLAR